MKLYRQVDNKIELCILPKMEQEVNKIFGQEIKQGYREVLPDGRIYFVFEIAPEKAILLHRVSRWIGQKQAFIPDGQKNAS